MTKKEENFFKSLEYGDFLVMKLLSNVLKRMDRFSDEASKKIFDNIDILKNYKITLADSLSNDNYVWTADDLAESKMMISSKSSEDLVCHEFGHLLLDLFANGEVPEEFDHINELCVERLNSRQDEIEKMIEQYSNEVYKLYEDNGHELLGFLNRHPEAQTEYFERNPYDTEEECRDTIIYSFLSLLTNFDSKIAGYNKISGIIDSMYQGENPFEYYYGTDVLYPLLSMHESEYFKEDEISPEKASFEEQFADYLVMRLYTDMIGDAVGTFHNLVGDEWFEMMDRHYNMVADRVCERGKVFEKKIVEE